jgi:hypothetical protein
MAGEPRTADQLDDGLRGIDAVAPDFAAQHRIQPQAGINRAHKQHIAFVRARKRGVIEAYDMRKGFGHIKTCIQH